MTGILGRIRVDGPRTGPKNFRNLRETWVQVLDIPIQFSTIGRSILPGVPNFGGRLILALLDPSGLYVQAGAGKRSGRTRRRRIEPPRNSGVQRPMNEASRIQGWTICAAAGGLALLFVLGLLNHSYWAIALPVAVLTLFVLGLAGWVGYTIATIQVEADPVPEVLVSEADTREAAPEAASPRESA